MGRHSSPERWPFLRSLLAWVFPWVIVASVVAGAAWVAVDAVDGNEVEPEVTTASPSPTVEGLPEPAITPSSTPIPTPDDGGPVVYEGVTAQVLNATGGVDGAAQRMADRLARLGFDIVAIDTALGEMEITTVYWTSPEGRPVAEALAEDNGWIAAKKPDNLSASVQIHVLVGKDEP